MLLIIVQEDFMFSSQLNPYEEINPHLNSKQRHAISEKQQANVLFFQ